MIRLRVAHLERETWKAFVSASTAHTYSKITCRSKGDDDANLFRQRYSTRTGTRGAERKFPYRVQLLFALHALRVCLVLGLRVEQTGIISARFGSVRALTAKTRSECIDPSQRFVRLSPDPFIESRDSSYRADDTQRLDGRSNCGFVRLRSTWLIASEMPTSAPLSHSRKPVHPKWV